MIEMKVELNISFHMHNVFSNLYSSPYSIYNVFKSYRLEVYGIRSL